MVSLTFGRRFRVLLLGLLTFGAVAHAAMVDDFNDGTFSSNWVTNNYPQHSGPPNDIVTFTELTSERFDSNHANGYLRIGYDNVDSDAQIRLLLRSDQRLDVNGEFMQVDLRIESGANSYNVAAGLALAPTDNGINQNRSSCAYIVLRNDGYLKINAYGTGGTEIYDQNVELSGYQTGDTVTLRVQRTASGEFAVYWGTNLDADIYAGSFNFGAATHPTVPGLVLSNGFADFQAGLDRFIVGTTGGIGRVTDFGAMPNDGINDSVLVQAMISDHDRIFFPPGEYVFDSQVFTRSNQVVEGDDYRNVTIVLNSAAGDAIAWRMDNRVNVTLEDMTVSRRASNARGSMVRADYATNILVYRIRANDNNSTSPAFEFTGCTNITARQCLVWNTQSYFYSNNLWWTYGQGIRMDQCVNITVAECRVQQETPLVLTDPTPTLGYYQATGIETVGCTSGTITCNLVEKTGQGIDTSLSDHLEINHNFIDECQSIGIKLVNGSSYMNIHDNFIRRCGLVAIWLTEGTVGPGSHDNTVENNLFVKIGYFNGGSGFWNGHFEDSVPAGINFSAALTDATRVKNNTVINNTAWDNSWMVRGIVSYEAGTYMATPNTVGGNLAVSGEPPVSQYVEVGCSNWLTEAIKSAVAAWTHYE